MTDAETLVNAIYSVRDSIDRHATDLSHSQDTITDTLINIGKELVSLNKQLIIQNQLHSLQIKLNAPFTNDEQLDSVSNSLDDIFRNNE